LGPYEGDAGTLAAVADVAAGALAAAGGDDVAAGVRGVTGAGGGCSEGGVTAAGALPALVALFAPGVDVEFSGLAGLCAGFAVGAAEGGVAVADVGALTPAAGAVA